MLTLNFGSGLPSKKQESAFNDFTGEMGTTVTTRDHEAADSSLQSTVLPPVVESEASRRELVRRIVNSPTFVRSERLGSLLAYICDMALTGRRSELNEQTIGHKVFGRSQDYDSSVDGIVRSQASRLRRRLELYFEQEGAEEPIRIVVPRGGYVPIFEPRTTGAIASSMLQPAAPVPEISPAPIQQTNPQMAVLRRWGVSFALALMLVALWVHDHRHHVLSASPPRTHPFWSQFFVKGQPTIVVAPDSGLVLYHGMSGRDIDIKQYLDGGYRAEPNSPPLIGPDAPQSNWLLDLANRRYTSMVDLKAILSLRDHAEALGSTVSVRYARDLRPNDLKSGNIILLGASSADPWVFLYERNMNFVLGDDYTKYYWVLNRKPQKGEPAKWESARTDPQPRVFGVVAYLSDLSGDGNTLIIEGTSMAGTECAMDFLNDDTGLLPFLNRIRRRDGSLPHFELLLETVNMESSSVRSEILAWRTMQ